MMGRQKNRVFALYKGELNVCDGTVEEIAEQTGVSVGTIRFYASSAYRRRLQDRRDRGVGGEECIELVELEDAE